MSLVKLPQRRMYWSPQYIASTETRFGVKKVMHAPWICQCTLHGILHQQSSLPIQVHQNCLVLSIMCQFHFRHHLEASSPYLGRYHLIIQIVHLHSLKLYQLPGLVECPHHSIGEGVYLFLKEKLTINPMFQRTNSLSYSVWHKCSW